MGEEGEYSYSRDTRYLQRVILQKKIYIKKIVSYEKKGFAKPNVRQLLNIFLLIAKFAVSRLSSLVKH